MRIYEPKNKIDVTTPQGDGSILFITEFGTETDTIYTIVINSTGELWQYTHKDFKIKSNITFKRYNK
jgi:hypothetical protein